MSAIKISFLIAIAGHLLCGVCDCLLTYMPDGRFCFEDMKDNDRLSAVFRDMPPLNSLLSMLLGRLAMFLFAFGYLVLAYWMRAFSEPCAVLMPEGMLLRKSAEEILEMAERTKAEFSSMGDAVTGDVFIGNGKPLH